MPRKVFDRNKVVAVKPGNSRVTGTEQFYTPPAVAAGVVQKVLLAIPDARDRPWLEPAGGTGVFVNAFRAAGIVDVTAFDLFPHHPGVVEANFLSTTVNLKRAVCVTNPPFGRNNSLSVPFFNHAAKVSDDIVMIIPCSWRKWSVQNRLDRFFHLLSDEDLIVDYTDAEGVPGSAVGTLRTCVQHWVRRDSLRDLQGAPDHRVIERCGPELADATIVLFGWSCGTVLTEFERILNSTRMYVRLIHPRALEALQVVDYGRFSRNVAYTPALSFKEINFLLNEYLGLSNAMSDKEIVEDA